MALHLHLNGVTSLQYDCHTRSRFPSTTAIGTCLAGFETKASKHFTSLKHLRLLRTVQCAAAASKGVSLDKGPKHDEKELPPLLPSLEVEGLPPCQGSVYADESLARILTIGPADLFGHYYVGCNSFTSFVHCGAVSAERLAAIAGLGTWMTFLDDILFDDQDGGLLEKLGIDPTILANPERIMQCFCALDAILLQDEKPASPTVIEDMTWKLGRDLRALSPSREWFKLCVDAVVDFHTANYEFYCDNLGADRAKPLPDLAAYTKIRSRTMPGQFFILAFQFCQNSFLPPEIREHPVVQRLNALAITYIGYVQDIFSYSKELAEGSTYNLFNVLMAGEPGVTLPQAAWKAVNMTRALAQELVELEATQLPSWEDEPWASDVHLYVEGLKEAMSGFLYWHSKTRRYRHPDAPFPELRDVSVSFLPEPDSLKVMSK